MTKIKQAITVETTPSLAMTYASIKALKDAGSLVAGGLYRITDNQTIHNIPNSVALNVHGTVYESASSWTNTKSEGVEELILTAATTNAFAPNVVSPTFPNDIIQFNFDDILCEDGVTARRGKIIYRKDTSKNLEAYYDWRKVKFRRYKIAPVAWAAGTTYAKWAPVLASNGDVYVSKRAGNLGNDPAATPIAGNGGSAEYAIVYGIWWEKIVLGVKNQYLGWSNTATQLMASFTMPLNTADFQDFYTFNTATSSDFTNPLPLNKGDVGLMKSIKIGYHSTYNNIIFADQYEGGNRVFNNTFDEGCINSLFYGVNISNNVIGRNSVGNICQGSWYNNVFLSNCSTNYSVYMNQKYWWGVKDNFFGSNYGNNLHTADFDNNTVLEGGNLTSNMWQYNTQRNTFQGFIYNTVFGYECTDNLLQFVNSCTIGYQFKSNQCVGGADEDKGLVSSTIGDFCRGNIIRSMSSCTVGNNFKNNIIEGVFKTLTIPDGFQNNKSFGTIAPNTYFAVNTLRNVFNNNFGGGTSGVPLALIDCVFNKPVSGMQTAAAVVLTRVQSDVPITNKTLPASLTDINISYVSPNGTLWYSAMSDAGVITNTSIV
jgi:hypothetical protein